MLSVNNVTIDGNNRYGGAPTFGVNVEFRVGDKSYNTVALKLTPEDAREIVELAIAKATAMLQVQPSEIRIEGEPLPLIDEALDPEFAEVEEYSPPIATAPKPTTEEPI
jgi:hypothetical protein